MWVEIRLKQLKELKEKYAREGYTAGVEEVDFAIKKLKRENPVPNKEVVAPKTDYRISLEELDRVRHSCMEAGRMVQEFVDTEEARLGRRPHFYLPTVSPHETIKVPHSEQAMHAGAAGREIIAVACSVPPKDEIPYCEAVYIKDNGDCGVVRGPYAEVLPIEKHKWVGRG